MRQNWDQKKTLKQNFRNLGLAFDANAAVPIPKRKVKVSSLVYKHLGSRSIECFFITFKKEKPLHTSFKLLNMVHHILLDSTLPTLYTIHYYTTYSDFY